MIQDIAPHVFHNEYAKKKPSEDSLFLFYNGQKILIRTPEVSGDAQNQPKEPGNPKIAYFTLAQIRSLLPSAAEYIECNSIYLFSINTQDFFLFMQPQERQMPSHEEIAGFIMDKYSQSFDNGLATLHPLSVLRTGVPRHLAFAGITGHQLYLWYQSRRFCGKCGRPLRHSDKERMMYCEHCHHMEYPVLCPAVIVAVTHGDKLLLTKYEGRDYKRYALIAGFAEIGESIEETVRREVMEEVGLRVKNIRYYKSQPWSFSGTLLFGFFCDLDGDDTITLDTEELSVADWFTRDEIMDDGENVSLTREMMRVFKTSRP